MTRLVSLRALAAAPVLEGEHLVTHRGQIYGTFVPTPRAGQDDGDRGAVTADPVESDGPGGPTLPVRRRAPEGSVSARSGARAQVERDKILRKVAKGG